MFAPGRDAAAPVPILYWQIVIRALMSRRLHQAIALWFVLQIVLPFTAPLQTLDFHDLFGGKSHHAATTSPESTTTPTMTDASPVAAIASLLAPAAATAVDRVASGEDVTAR